MFQYCPTSLSEITTHISHPHKNSANTLTAAKNHLLTLKSQAITQIFNKISNPKSAKSPNLNAQIQNAIVSNQLLPRIRFAWSLNINRPTTVNHHHYTPIAKKKEGCFETPLNETLVLIVVLSGGVWLW